MNQFTISGSPHVHGDESVKKIMYTVIIALIPALLVSIYFFGWDAVRITLVSVAACVLCEWLIQKFLIKGECTICDGSAALTGILLAFNVPANLPSWMLVIGAFVAIGVAKMSFGGLGKNPFNPALVGRVFMLISFPEAMTTWPKAHAIFAEKTVTDAITGPTTLGVMKEGLGAGKTTEEIMNQLAENYTYIDSLFGNRGGSLGEMCVIAITIGAIFLIWRKVIDWQTPVTITATVFCFAGLFYLIDPMHYAHPLFHVLNGGLLFGAVFMATDMVTSPMTIPGKIVFALGIGLLTIIIRLWGAYPEGMSFAILIMNAFVPLINKGFKPKRFGVIK